MSWTKEKIEQHKEAAKRLDSIVSEAFGYLREREGVSEYELREFVLFKIKEQGMEVFDGNVIVAFGVNTQYVHYFPSQYCRKLKAGELVMIDTWARLKERGAPHADITRMGGVSIKNEKLKIKKYFYDLLVKGQDRALKFLRSRLRRRELPTGREVDGVVREYLSEALKDPSLVLPSPRGGSKRDVNRIFCHTLGHSLGVKGPHGQVSGFSPRNKRPIRTGMGYTIEPGLYFPKKFGLRSEIDIFIDNHYNIEVTSKRYRDLEEL